MCTQMFPYPYNLRNSESHDILNPGKTEEQKIFVTFSAVQQKIVILRTHPHVWKVFQYHAKEEESIIHKLQGRTKFKIFFFFF